VFKLSPEAEFRKRWVAAATRLGAGEVLVSETVRSLARTAADMRAGAVAEGGWGGGAGLGSGSSRGGMTSPDLPLRS